MDPNETLRLIRERVAIVLDGTDAETINEAANQLAGHVRELDEWLTRGGFAPDAWRGLEPAE